MLQITIPATNELFDEENNEFITIKEQQLQLEHSLVSISKWESKWHKPFLGNKTKTDEETLDYIRCMTLTKNVDPNVYITLSSDTIEQITKYIYDSMTAAWFSEDNNKKSSSYEVITSEIIYYWMITLNIPVEFQKWHLNRLLTLVRVCNEKNAPPKKMSRQEIMSRNKAINEARKRAGNTRG